MLDTNIQAHTLFGSQMSEQKSQTGPQYILGFIQKTQSSPRHVAGKKPKQFRSITLCRIYTPQYISGKLGEFRTVKDMLQNYFLIRISQTERAQKSEDPRTPTMSIVSAQSKTKLTWHQVRKCFSMLTPFWIQSMTKPTVQAIFREVFK